MTKKTGATLLIARKCPTQFLSIFLSALLAWPPCLPIQATEPTITCRVEGPPQIVAGEGLGFQNRERKAWLDERGWSDPADNFEDSDGRDDLLYAPLAFSLYPFDLPSLVPLTLESRIPGSGDRSSCFLFSPPLRC